MSLELGGKTTNVLILVLREWKESHGTKVDIIKSNLTGKGKTRDSRSFNAIIISQ